MLFRSLDTTLSVGRNHRTLEGSRSRRRTAFSSRAGLIRSWANLARPDLAAEDPPLSNSASPSTPLACHRATSNHHHLLRRYHLSYSKNEGESLTTTTGMSTTIDANRLVRFAQGLKWWRSRGVGSLSRREATPLQGRFLRPGHHPTPYFTSRGKPSIRGASMSPALNPAPGSTTEHFPCNHSASSQQAPNARTNNARDANFRQIGRASCRERV